MNLVYSYSLLALSTVLFSGGTWLLKHCVDTGDLKYLAASFATLACANLAFMPLLADGFSRGIIMSAMASQILALIIGTAFYAEPVTTHKAIAFCFALAAIILISTPTNAGN